jgi:hypothetical protein
METGESISRISLWAEMDQLWDKSPMVILGLATYPSSSPSLLYGLHALCWAAMPTGRLQILRLLNVYLIKVILSQNEDFLAT